MKTKAHLRSVEVYQQPERISDFLEKTNNLIRWAGFFQKIVYQENNQCHFMTPLGMSETRMLHDKTNHPFVFVIESYFKEKNRKEWAQVMLNHQNHYSVITFQLNLPEALSDEIIHKQLCSLESELQTLKRILEEQL